MLELARKAQKEKERGPRMAGMWLRLGMEGCNAGWELIWIIGCGHGDARDVVLYRGMKSGRPWKMLA